MMGSLARSSGFPVFVDLPCGYTPRALEMSEQGIVYFGLDLPPVISEMDSIIPLLVSENNRNLVHFCPVDAINFKLLEKALEDAVGCWITADPEIAPEHIRIQSAIHPGGADFDTHHMLSEKAERIRIAGHLEKTRFFSTLTHDQQEAVPKAVEDIALWKVVSAGPARNIKRTAHRFTIHSELTDGVLDLRLTGRLDSLTAPRLLEVYEAQSASGSIRKVQADCNAPDYISSAGLRILIIMRKGCKEGVSLTGVNDTCADILMQTGLSEFLDIKTDSPDD